MPFKALSYCMHPKREHSLTEIFFGEINIAGAIAFAARGILFLIVGTPDVNSL